MKDVRVPEQLMRAMAAEAEAARDARAKVIIMTDMIISLDMMIMAMTIRMIMMPRTSRLR